MANSEPPPREVVETDEYTAQYEDIIRRHSLDIIGPARSIALGFFAMPSTTPVNTLIATSRDL